MEQLKQTLKELSELNGAPGFEYDVCNYIIGEAKKLDINSYHVDNMGNLYIKIEGKNPKGPIAHLDAHMDEPCFIVQYIGDNGFVYIAPLGLISENIMMGTRVRIQTDKGNVNGCIGVRSYHLSNNEEKSKTLQYDDMWIDIGADSREEVLEAGVKPGFPVLFDEPFRELLHNNVMSKAFDDRVGCAVLVEVMKSLVKEKPFSTVYLTFSTQEELILRGSRVIFNGFKKFFERIPDVSVVYDICLCGDVPKVKKNKAPVELGKGVGIKLYDKSSASHYMHVVPRKIVNMMESLCINNNIPYQYDFLMGCTNGDLFALEDIGVLTGGISIPCRYTHSAIEIVNLNDVDNAFKLTLNFINNLNKLS